MTDELPASAAPAAATDTAAPASQPAADNALPAASEGQQATATPPDDDFDENLVPETSRDNFRKYREKVKSQQADWEKRNNDAIRKTYEAEARAADVERRFLASQKPVDLAEVGSPPDGPVAPSLDDPNIKTMEDYNAAKKKYADDILKWRDQVAEWAGRKSLAEERQRQTQTQTARQQQEEGIRMAAKGRAAMQKYQDFQAVTAPFIQSAEQIPELQLFVRDSDTGTDVLYHLCKNPALLDGLAKMPTPYARAKELLRLESAINAPAPKAQTKAPEPMTPVGGGDGNVTKLLDLVKKDDVSEYIARSNREALRKRRGT